MNHATNPVASVPITPVVSWPRQARPGERYLITIDLRMDSPDDWPYEDEEYVVALMLSGQTHLQVNALGDTSVVLHRFGGTYGPARFMTTVGDETPPGTNTSLWLTLISAGGVPFHTARLPITITPEAPARPPAPDVSPATASVRAPTIISDHPPTRLPILAGTGADIWSMVAFHDETGRPALAMGTDDGKLRVWWPSETAVYTYEIARGRAHVAPLHNQDGQTRLLAASDQTFLLLDPAAGTVLARSVRPDLETVTSLAPITGAHGATDIAVGTSKGTIYLLQNGQPDSQIRARLTGHAGAVYSMTSLQIDGRSILASAGLDTHIRIWDARTYQLLRRLSGHESQINEISTVTGTGSRAMIASASDDGTVLIWDVTTGQSIERRETHNDWVNSVIELPNRQQHPMLLWGGREGVLRWALQGATEFSGAVHDDLPVTMLTSFAWAGRLIVAIARAGGEVTLRHVAEFEIGQRRPPKPKPEPMEADAVIVIPNILGSELVDTTTGDTLWGLSGVRWLTSAWTSGSMLPSLQVTNEERAGHDGRIRATRLLRTPTLMPGFAGIEPYTPLTRSLQRACRHPEAVLEFPYDWRLPVAHNARLLEVAAEEHLQRWRSHPAGSTDARIVLVAHGAGGLIARSYVSTIRDPSSSVRLTVGIGVPYSGTVKALDLIAGSGSPLPLPRRLMRELAVTLPGFYDLLPSYRCVHDGAEVRHLKSSDVALLGGDPELAAGALSHRHRTNSVPSGEILSIVGIDQPTPQSVRLKRGSLITQNFLPTPDENGTLTTTDYGGDGTVPRFSAIPPGDYAPPIIFAQTSGALCRDRAVIATITAKLNERKIHPPL